MGGLWVFWCEITPVGIWNWIAYIFNQANKLFGKIWLQTLCSPILCELLNGLSLKIVDLTW